MDLQNFSQGDHGGDNDGVKTQLLANNEDVGVSADNDNDDGEEEKEEEENDDDDFVYHSQRIGRRNKFMAWSLTIPSLLVFLIVMAYMMAITFAPDEVLQHSLPTTDCSCYTFASFNLTTVTTTPITTKCCLTFLQSYCEPIVQSITRSLDSSSTYFIVVGGIISWVTSTISVMIVTHMYLINPGSKLFYNIEFALCFSTLIFFIFMITSVVTFGAKKICLN